MGNAKWNLGLVLLLLVAGLGSFSLAQTTTNYAYPAEIAASSFLPATIHSGDVVSLAVDVHNRNTGTPITDLNTFLDLGSQFEPLQASVTVPFIGPNATQTIVFKFRVLEQTIPGYYPILLNLNYQSLNGPVRQTESIVVPISKSEQNLDVTVTPNVISPGSRSEMVISVQNVSQIPISNLSVSWQEEDSLILPLGSDNKRYFSIIQAGQKQEVVYQIAVDPNIPTGIYPLEVTLEYNDSNGVQTQVTEVGMIVGGRTDFEISAERTETQLSVSIANTGSNNANAVVAKIVGTKGVMLRGSSTSILGNLNKGDYTIASFQMQGSTTTNVGAPTTMTRTNFGGSGNQTDFNNGSRPSGSLDANTARLEAPQVTVEITYTDTTGERQTVRKEIMLAGTGSTTFARTTTTGTQAGGWTNWIVVGIVLLAGILFNFFVAKKSWKQVGLILVGMIVLLVGLPIIMGNAIPLPVFVALMGLIALAWFFRENLQEWLRKTKKEKK